MLHADASRFQTAIAAGEALTQRLEAQLAQAKHQIVSYEAR